MTSTGFFPLLFVIVLHTYTKLLEVTHTDAIEESEPPPKAVKIEEIIQEVEPEPPKKPLTTDEDDEESKPKKQQGRLT